MKIVFSSEERKRKPTYRRLITEENCFLVLGITFDEYKLEIGPIPKPVHFHVDPPPKPVDPAFTTAFEELTTDPIDLFSKYLTWFGSPSHPRIDTTRAYTNRRCIPEAYDALPDAVPGNPLTEREKMEISQRFMRLVNQKNNGGQ